MPLRLTHRPTIVARQTRRGPWVWSLDADAVETLRTLVRTGLAATAQRRDSQDDVVLLAWSVADQRAQADEAAKVRAMRHAAALYAPRNGATPRVYRPKATPRAMRTHAPYMYEPARW